MIIKQIKDFVKPGMVIPKPEATASFTIKGWGKRRNEEALVYCIPNYTNPDKPYQKGIGSSEFERAYRELMQSNKLTRSWFEKELPGCAKEGGCNFTTIGGIFELIGVAKYTERGVYHIVK